MLNVPNAARQEFRSRLVDTVDDDLFNQLVMTYAELEVTRARFVTAFALVDKPLAASDATSLMHLSYKLGRLRRTLADTGAGGRMRSSKTRSPPSCRSSTG
jgi:hypothetical protein